MPQVFTHEDFGEIRTIVEGDKIKFVAVDVCRALDIKNPTMTLANFDEDERAKYYLGHPYGEVNVVTEEGLYRLIFMSRKPEAKKFQRWIFHEVIPSIRKHGVYMTPAAAEKIISDPDFIINLAQQVKAERAKVAALTVEVDELKGTVAAQAQQITELQPKGVFYDLLLSCKGAWAVGVIAKDYGMKAPQFNQLLHEMGLQYQLGKPGRKYWILTQKALDMQKPYEQWTMTETRTFQNRNGEQCLGTPFMRWTQQGRIALYHLLKERGILPQSEQPHTESDASENN